MSDFLVLLFSNLEIYVLVRVHLKFYSWSLTKFFDQNYKISPLILFFFTIYDIWDVIYHYSVDRKREILLLFVSNLRRTSCVPWHSARIVLRTGFFWASNWPLITLLSSFLFLFNSSIGHLIQGFMVILGMGKT